MHLHPLVMPSLALLCLAAPARAITYSDWQIQGSGGMYVTADYEETDAPDGVENTYFASCVTGDGSAMQLNSVQYDVPTYAVGDLLWAPTNYWLTITTQFALNMGQKVTGMAQFATDDYPGYADRARLTMGGLELWSACIEDVFQSPYQETNTGPWVAWEFIAPAKGVFGLNFAIFGDDQMDSVARIRVDPIHTPDSSSTAMMLAVAMSLFAGLHRLLK